jgi:GPH family glycoside/pentoside/hexuronide:cation symporter
MGQSFPAFTTAEDVRRSMPQVESGNHGVGTIRSEMRAAMGRYSIYRPPSVSNSNSSLPVSLKTLFGVGQIAEGVKNTGFTIFLLFYYNSVLGLPGIYAGTALLIALVFDAVTDPLVGSLSDSFKHRLGRRHPFMYASAIPLALTYGLIFSPPEGLGQTGLFVWLTVFAILVRASMTLYHVPHMALGAELTTDYRERTVVVAYRSAFGALGMALVLGMGWTVFFPDVDGQLGRFDPDAYRSFGWIFGGIMLVSIVASAWGTRSVIPSLPRAPDDTEAFHPRRLIGELREALENRSFRALVLGLIVFFATRGVQDALNVHMGTYFWHLAASQIQIQQAAMVPAFVIGLPFWVAMTRFIDKGASFRIGIGLLTFFTMISPLLQIVGMYPPPESPAYLGILVLCSMIAVFGATAGIVNAGSMIADVTDEHELRTGRRQEGIFFAALAFAVKATVGVGQFVAGVSLDVIGLTAGATPDSVSAETVRALGIVYGPGTAVLGVASLFILLGYRLDRKRHAEIATALAARRVGVKESNAFVKESGSADAITG